MNPQQYTELSWSNKIPEGIHSSVQFGTKVFVGRNVTIEENVVIGHNVLLSHNVVVRPNAVIGNDVQLRAFVHVDPDAVIGDGTHVFPYGLVGGGWKLGKKVWYGPFTVTTNSSIPTVLNPSTIGDYCVVYSGCEIAPGVSIGEGGVLGMGSVLTKSIPPLEMWYGHPAKFKKNVDKINLFVNDEEWEDILFRKNKGDI